MEFQTALLFAATVLPLICTPGPDMLFVASQALSGGVAAGLRSMAGICLGYVVHSLFVALGLAAVVAASPALFEALRWLGVAYMLWLAVQLVRSALRSGSPAPREASGRGQLGRGFLTAVLNPKGMMIYVAILPQFMDRSGNAALEAAILSAVFVGLCGLVYTILSVVLPLIGGRSGLGDRHRRIVEATAGGLLVAAAGRLAAG